MQNTPIELESWGRYPRTRCIPRPICWRTDPLPKTNGKTILPYGLGRSYGDSCLNDGGVLLQTRWMNKFISFDKSTGVLSCEAGTTLDEILQLTVPCGWFLPTTPGTRFVTMGGAIANDVHGKNHHRAGTFGCHVRRFELRRSDGETLLCSTGENPEWFHATIGGLGLTGLITWAEFQLRAIDSGFIQMESIKFGNLTEFFAISEDSDRDFEYTVAWIDALACGASLGRGIFMRGNHAAKSPTHGLIVHGGQKLEVPVDAPNFLLNPVTVRGLNFAYYQKQQIKVKRSVVHYDPFFYPLDAIGKWNRIYGRRGFFQYQSVVPFTDGPEVSREMLSRIGRSGQASFLTVLKTFGRVTSPGMLSFPRPGITLALDFPNNGQPTMKLFAELDEIVRSAGGRIYPAKDARMSAQDFQDAYPQWKSFARYIDPRFSSSFWRRVTKQH
jgi:FAD/FMN-containing dehydrogenase